MALAGLACLAEPATAGAIAVALVDADDQVLAAGHRLLRQILESVDAAGIRTLIAHAQTWVTELPREPWERWWKLSAHDVRRIVSGRDGVAFLVLASGHHSGYVREEAVRQISGATDAFVLAALRERLNDWVGPVRAAASHAMRVFLDAGRAPELLSALSQFSELERCGRDDHRPLLDQVRMVLKEPAARDALRRGILSPDQGARRHAYAILLEAEQSSDNAVSLGLDSRDPWIRLHAARRLRELVAVRDPEPFLPRLLASSRSLLRQMAIEIVAERYGGTGTDRIRPFLLDRNATVREFARYYVAKLDPRVAIVETYRTAIATGGTDRLAAVAGLGELGATVDADRIQPFLSDRSPSVRAAACRALDRLRPESDTTTFLDALGDANGRVRARAIVALDRRALELPLGVLAEMVRGPDGSVRRVAALLLIARRPLFSRLPLMAELCSDADERVATLARSAIEKALRIRWDGYLQASADELSALARALPSVPTPLRLRLIELVRNATRASGWPER